MIKMIKMIFVNHSERSPVPKRSQESYRKEGRNSDCEPKMNGRESAMATAITSHNCKRPRHNKKDCNQLNKKPDKSGTLESR